MTLTTRAPAVIDTTGEVVPLDINLAISAEDAGSRLLIVQNVLRELRRYEGFLTQVISDEIKSVEGRSASHP